MNRTAAIACLALAASCATVPRGALRDPSLAQFAQPGPNRVVEYDLDWFDARRQRHVPVHIYAPAEDSGQPRVAVLHPVIIFSHGVPGSRLDYGYLGSHWASYGYVSMHPEHTHATRVEIPEDLHFVVDQLHDEATLPPPLRGRIDRAHIAVAGHSIGAYGALALGGLRVLLPDGSVRNFRDPRVTAAIPMSMSENFGPSSYTEIAIPMLHITGTRDWDLRYGTWLRKRRVPFKSIDRDDQYLVVVGGASHSTFSDTENAGAHPSHDVIRMTTIVFLNAYLRDDRSALAALGDGRLASALDGLGRLTVKSTPALRIGKISVHTEPLFDPQEASRGGFYRAANVLAVRTPEELIRKFLLFREGEELDAEKLTETERNLRAFDFLKTVTITAGQPHDGLVDVDVTTQDAFSTDFEADFSNDGGRSLYTAAVTQLDLFGKGSQVGVRTEQGRERRLNSIGFADPAIFGRYWDLDALLSKNSDGNQERLAIERPLFSSSTHFTLSALVNHLLQTGHIYDRATTSSLFDQQHRELLLLVGPAIKTGVTGNVRILAGADFLTDTFAPIAGIAPDNRRFHFIQLGVDSTHFQLVKENHVDYGLKEQDFNLGLHASADVARSARVWRIRTDDSVGYRLGADSFVITHLIASSRAGSTNRNSILSEDSRVILKFATHYPMTFVSRLRLDFGSHLDRDVQFFGDGQNGLRAYPNFAFEGSRRIVLNLEQRFFLGRELLQIFEPGAAIFVDSGRVGGSGSRSDFGAGVRFAIPRYESTIIRVDAAYAVNDSPISKRGLVISIATTQAF